MNSSHDVATGMKRQGGKWAKAWLAVILFSMAHAMAQIAQPMKLIQTIELPEGPTFPFAGDLAVDIKGNRLFAATQGTKSVTVVDLQRGAVPSSTDPQR